MTISPFEVSHLDQLYSRGLFIEPSKGLFEDICKRARPGETYTALDDSGIVRFVGGIALYWVGVGEAWVLYDKELRKNLRQYFTYTGIMLYRILEDNNLHRVQTVCEATPLKMKFLERLGFKRQCLLKKYNADKTDSFLYEFVEGDL